MCGIAGIYRYRNQADTAIDRTVALRMVDCLVHRGPDDGGLLIDANLALGHRRLSILDLSDRGRQPMCDASGRVWVAFNGEIYNFRSLRCELEAAGHAFVSETDTEVILYAYRQWGLDCVRRFNGMFALALWDADRERLWLARDPIGIKPLYYHDDGQTLHFASEIKAILADDNIPRRPDFVALDDFLTFSYTPAPRTGFEGVRQLLPGHSLVIESGQVHETKYFQWPYPRRPSAWDQRQSAQELAAAIDQSVARQMVADVPVGAFLSGGVDSSAVVAAMKSHAGISPLAFCVGFDDESFDESPIARDVARRLDVDLVVEQLTPQFEQLLLSAISHAEEPLADNSMLAVFLLSEATRRHVKVALSGDGGDELLAGYATYRASRYAAMYRRIPQAIRRHAIGPLVRLWPSNGRKYAAADFARRFVAGAEEGPLRDHSSWRRILSDDQKRSLYAADLVRAARAHNPLAQYVSAGNDAPEYATPLARQLQMDLAFHLPNDMLVKVDRMSMAHSLEVRVPLLDLQVIETALAIPPKFKLRGRCGKYVLKRVLEARLPRSITRRKKAGFVLPIERWLAGPARPLLREYVLSGGLAASGLLDRRQLERLVLASDRHVLRSAYELFALLVLSVWWSMWIERCISVQCVQPASFRPTRVLEFREPTRLNEAA